MQSAKGDNYTPTFTVRSSPWTIYWHVDAEDTEYFNIGVIDPATGATVWNYAWTLSVGATGAEILTYTRSGSYYLYVNTYRLTTRWTVGVRESQ